MHGKWYFILFILSTKSILGFSQSQVLTKIIRSEALQGNLIGDDPNRSVSIYLPPSYLKDSTRRFPVVYFLHGYTDSNEKWYGGEAHWINLPELADSYFEELASEEMILVTPNAYNRFKGSMYSNSITIGDWETFIVKELVQYIDDHFRTKASFKFRGLAGHSMGGYGTARLAMKYPGVFTAIYLLSPCCMEMNVNPNAGLRKNAEAVSHPDQIEAQPFFVSATLAISAAWAPNPSQAPLYLDLPFENGADRPEIVAKFHANSILPMLDQYVSNLDKLTSIGMDVGNKDWGISQATKKLHERLDLYGIAHQYEEYDGDHTNRIAERMRMHLFPFFSVVFSEE